MNRSRSRRAIVVWSVLLAALGFVSFANPARAAGYKRMDLVSDSRKAGVPKVDSHLNGPWGLVYTPDGLLVVADNGNGLATVYRPSGQPQRTIVNLPTPAGVASPSAPTGIVMNHTNAFLISSGGKTFPSEFLFATEEGTILGYNDRLDPTNAILAVNNFASGAVYKGLARGRNANGVFLYAANFHTGTVDVFDSAFAPATLAGSFTDPDLPAGFAPFGIRNIGGQLYVTYAKQDVDRRDDVPGPGNGLVDIFTTDGQFLRRLTSEGGVLNSPWGLAIAPDRFGRFSNAILVGNSGDGRIHAFSPADGAYLGQLETRKNKLITIDGLRGFAFARSVAGKHALNDEQADLYLRNILHFAAQPTPTPPPAHQFQGLLGLIRPDPTSGKPPHQ